MPRLTIDIEARFAQLQDSISRVEGVVTQSAGRMQSAFSGVSKAFGAIAALGAAAGLRNMVQGVLDVADGLNKLSQRSGIAVETLSELQYAAKLSDVSAESFSTSLRQLAKNIDEGAEGFQRLGINTRNADGSLRRTDQVLLDVAEKFSQVQDGAAKAAIAQELLGRSGADLIPLLNAGRSGLAAYADEARRLGVVISSDTARAAEEFNDNMTRLRESMSSLANSVTVAVLPTLVRLSSELVEGAKAAGGFLNAIRVLGTINPFRDNAENLRAYRKELERVQSQRDQYAKMGASTDRFDQEIAVLKARLEFLKYQERASIQTGGAGNMDARDRQLAAEASKQAIKAAPDKERAARAAREQAARDREAVEAARELGRQTAEVARERAAVAEAYNRVDLAAQDERQRASLEAAAKAAADLQAILGRTQSGQLAALEQQQLLLNDALVEGKISAEQFTEAFEVLDVERNQVLGRTKESFTGIADAGTKAFRDLEAAVRGWGNQFTDTLADMVMSGKAAFGDLIDAIIRDLLRMQIQARITAPLFGALNQGLNSLFGGGGGAAMAQPGLRLPARAAGGPVAGGSAYLVGERGPEVFVPTQSGMIIPNRGSMGVTMNLQVNVDARSDAATVRQAVTAAAGLAQAQIARGLRVGR